MADLSKLTNMECVQLIKLKAIPITNKVIIYMFI